MQLQHAGVDELHAPVLPTGQGIQNFGVENKGALHPLKAAQCMVERGMVITAQIAPQPHQGGSSHGNIEAQDSKASAVLPGITAALGVQAHKTLKMAP
jgi:hypothetical protein